MGEYIHAEQIVPRDEIAIDEDDWRVLGVEKKVNGQIEVHVYRIGNYTERLHYFDPKDNVYRVNSAALVQKVDENYRQTMGSSEEVDALNTYEKQMGL